VHTLVEDSFEEVDGKDFLFSACNVSGTMVNFCCGIEKRAPPLIDISFVPGGATCLYSLFEWGLTNGTFQISFVLLI